MENKKETVAKIQKSVVDETMMRIEEIKNAGGLNLPTDYSIQNAIQAAGLVLADVLDKNKKPALEVCTKSSIANSLLYMITQGLNPLKNQCYFIVYGNKLTCQRSYEGSKLLAKRYSGIIDVIPHTIYEGDEFEYEINLDTGLKQVIKHKSSINNINQEKIVGAYAIIIRPDGLKDIEVMPFADIKKAWLMRQGSGLTQAHKDFTDKMAEKTVINRACKKYIDSTNDAMIIIDSSENIEVEENNKGITTHILAEMPEPVSKQLPENKPTSETKSDKINIPDKEELEGGASIKEQSEEIPNNPNF